ncbi:MAG: thioredoxin domain-containing protein [Alphaproteobacteria bacterium]|nr:thioredoxin domain-containing protein [Alphaproteobacteria bacterium]
MIRFLMMAALLLAPVSTLRAEEALSAAQKEAVEALVKETISNNGDLILQSVQKFQADEQAKRQAEGAENVKKEKQALFHDSSQPFAGNKKGKKVAAEFFDYNCGYCKKSIDAVAKLIEDNKDLKFVFVELPILSPSSNLAARYALAANKQGKYWEYHQALMHFQGEKNEETLTKMAEEVGLNVDKLKKDAESDAVKKRLEQNQQLAQKLGISGTPAFVIGETLMPGAVPVETMQDALK